jgi:hypothetical protein
MALMSTSISTGPAHTSTRQKTANALLVLARAQIAVMAPSKVQRKEPVASALQARALARTAAIVRSKTRQQKVASALPVLAHARDAANKWLLAQEMRGFKTGFKTTLNFLLLWQLSRGLFGGSWFKQVL